MAQNSYTHLANDYFAGNCKYIIAATKKNHGIIKQPTGTGKSGVIFEDIIWNIKNKKPSRKVVFCIVSHILNLNAQTFNNFFYTLKNINILADYKTKLYLNSSTSTKEYEKMFDGLGEEICQDLDDMVKGDYDIAFVSSCCKSLRHFIKRTKELKKKGIDIICYIDECHSAVDDRKLNYEINLEELLKNSWKTYGLSATPSYFVKHFNTAYNKVYKKGYHFAEDECIINMDPADAIDNNLIIKPYVKILRTTDGVLTSMLINCCMTDAVNSKNKKGDLSAPYHKMLVTCSGCKEAKTLYAECTKLGWKCFINTSDDNDVDKDINKFCKAVNEHVGHCIIFHCRKLVQGIDINSITDAIIVNNSNDSVDNECRIIQIVGRALRTDKWGADEDHRNKKYANIYVVTNGNEQYEYATACVFTKYYGLNNIIFDESCDFLMGSNPLSKLFDSGRSVNTKNPFIIVKQTIDDLKLDFKKYITEDVLPVYKAIIENGGTIDIDTIVNSINFGALTSVNTMDLFDHTGQIKFIKQEFLSYGITI